MRKASVHISAHISVLQKLHFHGRRLCLSIPTKWSIGQELSTLPLKLIEAKKSPLLKESSHSSKGCLKNFRMTANVNCESSCLWRLSICSCYYVFPLIIKYKQRNCGHFQMKLKTNYLVSLCNRTKVLEVFAYKHNSLHLYQDPSRYHSHLFRTEKSSCNRAWE